MSATLEFIVKIGVSLPADLIAFADEEARRRRTSRSGFLARLLKAEQVREETRRYIDTHGWDVTEDEAAWRKYQRGRMAEEYRDDEW
ncbi:MAG: type II toxin-antitoxin system HicB family antitoxin [Thermoanaerobaculia bacterium]|nr:type II toxin-antitoxin system HicB family antitoxin [Thermoanaerobaculia bacterium]